MLRPVLIWDLLFRSCKSGGHVRSLPSDILKTPAIVCRVCFPPFTEVGGHYSFLHLEVYFPEKKIYCCCHSRCNCRKKRNMFGDTYFLWSIRLKNENPKNQRAFFTGKWIHSSFLSHKWLFFFSSVVCLFFACWYLFLVDMSVFVLCLLRFFDVLCPFVLCLFRCLGVLCSPVDSNQWLWSFVCKR